MIELYINQTYIELDDKSQVQVQAFNPATDEVLVSRAFSWPFSVPATGANMHALSHVNRLDALHASIELPARVRIGGGAECIGIVEMGSITRDRVELTFKNNARLLSDKLKEMRIKDLMPVVDIPVIVLPFWHFQLSQANEFFEDGVMAIVIWINGVDYIYTDPASYFVDAPTWDTFIHTAANWVVALINADYPGLASYNPATFKLELNPIATSPDLAVAFTYPPNSNIGITLEYRTQGHARRDNFEAFVEGLLSVPDERLFFPAVKARDFFKDKLEEKNSKYTGLLNENIVGQYATYDYYYLSEADGIAYPKMPFVPVAYVLKRISEALGYNGAYQVLQYDAQDVARMGIWNNVQLEGVTNEAPRARIPYEEYLEEKQLGGWLHYATQIDLANHLPDVSAADFLVSLCSVFNAYISDSDARLDLRCKSDQMLNAPIQATRYMTLDYEYTPSIADVQIKISTDPDDLLEVAGQLEPVGTGDIVLEVARPLPDEVYERKRYGKLSLASTLMQGQSELLGLKQEVKQLRYFLTTTSDTDPYVLSSVGSVFHATHYARNAQGVAFSPFQLEIPDVAGEIGLYNQFYRAWMPVLRGYEAVVYLNMPAHRVSILQEWVTVRMAIAIDMGQVMLLPSSLELGEQMNGATLMRVNGVILR
jgi:hypothetical protein